MDTDRVELDGNGEPMEAVLSAGKRHANLVATIAWCVAAPAFRGRVASLWLPPPRGCWVQPTAMSVPQDQMAMTCMVLETDKLLTLAGRFLKLLLLFPCKTWGKEARHLGAHIPEERVSCVCPIARQCPMHRTVTKPPLPYPGEDAGKEAARIAALPAHESQTWLLLEYCDKPCLQVWLLCI